MTDHTYKTKDAMVTDAMVTKENVREYFRALTRRPFDDSPGQVPGSVETVLEYLIEDDNGIYDSVSEYFFGGERVYLTLADVLIEIRNYIEDYIGDLQGTADLIPARPPHPPEGEEMRKTAEMTTTETTTRITVDLQSIKRAIEYYEERAAWQRAAENISASQYYRGLAEALRNVRDGAFQSR